MVEMEEEKLELPVQQVLHLPFAALQLIKQHQPHPTYQQPQRPLQHLQHKQQQQQQQSNKQQQTREYNDEQATDDIPTRASAISNDATNESHSTFHFRSFLNHPLSGSFGNFNVESMANKPMEKN